MGVQRGPDEALEGEEQHHARPPRMIVNLIDLADEAQVAAVALSRGRGARRRRSSRAPGTAAAGRGSQRDARDGRRRSGRRQLPVLERRRHVASVGERHELEGVGPREQRARQRVVERMART